MKFNEIDTKMRLYETNGDRIFLPEMYLVVRLDGRGFTQLTKTLDYEKPFDVRFADAMLTTTRALMEYSGFSMLYGYTQSDEISLLLKPGDNTFGRKERKIVSTLAGMASSNFSLYTETLASFDARVCQLPTKELVQDYFSWRMEDATRNALNGYCYWTLRNKDGLNGTQASRRLERLGVSDKNELLFERGINFNEVETWQKRGLGLYWTTIQKQGYNPVKDEYVVVDRNDLKTDGELPMKDEYKDFIAHLLNGVS
jgi:tRNA(His) guanylyltransferase